VKLNLPYLVADRDRHGNVRHYYRRKGKPKIRLKGEPGSDVFLEQYRLANEGRTPARKVLAGAAAGTLRWLCSEYYKSAAYRSLGHRTQRVRKIVTSARFGTSAPTGRAARTIA
jgi:hypothetical protein